MPERNSNAIWEGDTSGSGTVILGSGILNASYSFASRFEEGKGTNPEELLAGAHASSFSMALGKALAERGWQPRRVITTSRVTLSPAAEGQEIRHIRLNTQAEVPDAEPEEFESLCQRVFQDCPMSKALSTIPMELNAQLTNTETQIL